MAGRRSTRPAGVSTTVRRVPRKSYYGKVITGSKIRTRCASSARPTRAPRQDQIARPAWRRSRVTIPVQLNRDSAPCVKAEKDVAGRGQGAEEGSPTAKAMLKAGQSSDDVDHVPYPNGARRMVRQRQILESPALLRAGRLRQAGRPSRAHPRRRRAQRGVLRVRDSTAVLPSACRQEGLGSPPTRARSKPEAHRPSRTPSRTAKLQRHRRHHRRDEGHHPHGGRRGHFISRSWVPATNEQAEDRCHVGQDRPVVPTSARPRTPWTPQVAPTNDLGTASCGRTAQGQCREERNGT